jgi:hypothetical protein
MSWHAVAAVDDAVDATRRFLFPFSLVRWTKLAVLVLFMGGGGAGVNGSGPALSDSGVTPPSDGGTGSTGIGSLGDSVGFGSGSDVADRVAEAITPELLVAGAVGLFLLFVVVSVMSLSLRLAFYDALRTNEVRIVAPFLSRLRQSLGLFVFTSALGVVAAAPIAISVGVALVADSPTGWPRVDSAAGTLSSLPTGALVALAVLGVVTVVVGALALRFTYEFVVPAMIVDDAGVIDGWRRFLPTLRGAWSQLLVYLAVHFVISIGLSVVVGIATVLGFALIAGVGGAARLLVAALLGGLSALVGSTAGLAAIAIVAITGAVGLLILVVPVQVVTRSYRLVYEVSTLAGLDSDLTLLHPDLRSESDGATRSATTDDGGR